MEACWRRLHPTVNGEWLFLILYFIYNVLFGCFSYFHSCSIIFILTGEPEWKCSKTIYGKPAHKTFKQLRNAAKETGFVSRSCKLTFHPTGEPRKFFFIRYEFSQCSRPKYFPCTKNVSWNFHHKELIWNTYLIFDRDIFHLNINRSGELFWR